MNQTNPLFLFALTEVEVVEVKPLEAFRQLVAHLLLQLLQLGHVRHAAAHSRHTWHSGESAAHTLWRSRPAVTALALSAFTFTALLCIFAISS